MTQHTLTEFTEETTIQDTSKGMYKKIMKYKYGIDTLYAIIIKLLENNPDGYSINELAVIMQKERSTISPRVNELRERGIIKHLEERDSFVSGQKNNIWVLSNNYKELVKVIG